MSKIMNDFYIDPIRLLLVRQSTLKLSSEEFMVAMGILALQEQDLLVSTQSIGDFLNLKEEEVDDIISLLNEKGYLNIEVEQNDVTFNLNGLFSDEFPVKPQLKSVFKLFEEEFRRPLSQPELQQLQDWLLLYSEDDVIEALRSASIMQKLNFNYINRILVNDHAE